MKYVDLPYILSPSPGYPLIQSIDKDEIYVIIANDSPQITGSWQLVPASSCQDDSLSSIPLYPALDRIIELQNADTGQLCASLDQTDLFFSKELLKLLGPETRLFKLPLLLNDPDNNSSPIIEPNTLLHKSNGKPLATLFDIHLTTNEKHQIKHHSLCLSPNDTQSQPLRFIQITDTHLARRNDIICTEVSVEQEAKNFNNFNEKFRQTIHKLNADYENGQLDLIILSGDIIDFVEQSIDAEPGTHDNNWLVFYEMLTGLGNEPAKNNTGLKVPVFTSTGNHDWRLYPYDISVQNEVFHVSNKQAKLFNHNFASTRTGYSKKIDELYHHLVIESSPLVKAHWIFSLAKVIMQLATSWRTKAVLPIFISVFVLLASIDENNLLFSFTVASATLFITYGLQRFIFHHLERHVRALIDLGAVPLLAHVSGLHDYLLNINPYFNYTFCYGHNHFLLLDTGPDCLVAQDLWDDGKKKMHKVDFDELLGSSPDSQAFFPANEYYSVSQLCWMENILKLINEQNSPNTRIVVVLHAPPINTEKPPVIPDNEIEVKISRSTNIRYGTVNHYVSQFFHLCRGKKEGHTDYNGIMVDMVLSGHSHYAREYRIDDEYNVYFGNFSENAFVDNKFNQHRPFVLQTAACGPYGRGFIDTPYVRRIAINENGMVSEYKHISIKD